MSFTIKDGTGTGSVAKVDSGNRLAVRAVSENTADHAAEFGQRFSLNTGTLTLTSANESSVFYVKNQQSNNLWVDSLFVSLGISTGGTGPCDISVYFKTTSGTIVSDATAVEIAANMHLGSAGTMDVSDIFKGGEGKTQVGGVKSMSSLIPQNTSSSIIQHRIVIPVGQTLVIAITPPASNTSLAIQAGINLAVSTVDVHGQDGGHV